MRRIIKIPIFAFVMLLLLSMSYSQVTQNINTVDTLLEGVLPQPKGDLLSPAEEKKVMGAYYVQQAPSVVKPFQVYSYEQMINDAEALKRLYPDLIQTKSLGKTPDGRTLLLIKLGKGNKMITLNGSHHAREYISSTLLMKMVEEYAYCYKMNIPFKGYDARRILDQVTLYIVPMVNPDGVTLVQYGPSKLKNPDSIKKINNGKKTYKSWKANAKGVDLNYQYPFGWEHIRKLKGPRSEGYKGTSPAMETETKILMNFTLENPFLIHAAYHTQGEIIFWYNGQKGDLYSQSKKIGKNLSKVTGYKLLSESSQKKSYGGYKDWTVTTFKKPGFTIELCPYVGNFPYPDKWFNNVWNKAGATGLLLAKEAINIDSYDYQVYKGEKLVQLFNNYQDAVNFSKAYKFDKVAYLGKILWSKSGSP
ncbi:MAG: M14 family metallocarboxypeptidase [Clostridia bacterium]|nr:M14 family metallocarboxypeptidase [Clostridia bacterium]